MGMSKEDERRIEAYKLALAASPTAYADFLTREAEVILHFIRTGKGGDGR